MNCGVAESARDDNADRVIYELWQEEKGRRLWRFVSIVAARDGGCQVLVTEITFPTEDGAVTGMKGANLVPQFPPSSFSERGQAEAEAMAILESHLARGWLEVVHNGKRADRG